MRPAATEVISTDQLQRMIVALEGVLNNLPDSDQSPLPKDKVDAVEGAFLQDWRTICASSRFCRDRVWLPSMIAKFVMFEPGHFHLQFSRHAFFLIAAQHFYAGSRRAGR